MQTEFNKWLEKVVINEAEKTKKDTELIFASIVLSDAKAAFLDGVNAKDYKLTLF